MELILLPRQDEDTELPVGMIHFASTMCPFANLSHERGPTCCSFDATRVQSLLRRFGGDFLADLLVSDVSRDEAHQLGLVLRDAYINLLAFHRWYSDRKDNRSAHPSTELYEQARARGEEYPDWPFDKFVAEFEPLGQASEWLVRVGENFHGVHVVPPSAGRE